MIRKMQIADYSDVYNLWLANKGMGLNDVDDSESGIVRFLDRNPDTCFVAERDGRRGFIYHTAVHPDYHRQGIGSALVSAALETLRSVGITKVALVVFERNQGGNAFWEKQGFTVRNDLTYRNKALVEMVRKDT